MRVQRAGIWVHPTQGRVLTPESRLHPMFSSVLV